MGPLLTGGGVPNHGGNVECRTVPTALDVNGDHVAVICGNRAELLQVYLGCGWIGAVTVPINVASRGAQLAHILTNSQAKLLVVQAEHAEALETLEKVDTLVIDKTGTLTAGKLSVIGIVSGGLVGEVELLRLTASVERASEHPIASAILAAAQERSVKLSAVQNFESRAGLGIIGVVDGKRVAVGTLALMREEGITRNAFSVLGGVAGTVIYVAVDHAMRARAAAVSECVRSV